MLLLRTIMDTFDADFYYESIELLLFLMLRELVQLYNRCAELWYTLYIMLSFDVRKWSSACIQIHLDQILVTNSELKLLLKAT